MDTKHSLANALTKVLLPASILLGLYLTRLYSYLLFHTLVELVSILVAGTIFILAWNFRRFFTDSFLMFIGTAYLFVGILDLIHTLGYAGMGIFQGHDANLPTQLWVAARYLQSISLLLATLFLGRRVKSEWLLAGFGLVTALLLLSIFAWNIFPDSYIEGSGLTPFKVNSEYAIVLILGAAIFFLLRNRPAFHPKMLQLIVFSIGFTIAGELAFTLYTDVYGLTNMVGHFFKIIAFYLIYKSIIETAATSIYTDMTQLRRTEKALRESETELRTIVDNLTEGLIVADLDGNLLHWNRAALDLHGFSSLKEAQRKVSEFRDTFELGSLDGTVWPVEDWPVPRLLRGEQIDDLEVRIRRIGSNWERVFNYGGTLVHNEEGQPLMAVLTINDITERKQAEEELQKEREFLRKVIDTTPSMIFVKDWEGRFLLANEALGRTYGASPEEVVGRTDHDFNPNPEEVERFRQDDREVMLTREKKLILDEQVTHADGRVHWYSTVKVPLINEDGSCDKLLGVATETTELKRTEEEAIQNRTRVEVQHRLIEQREQERLQIARDLHDGPIQNLFGLTLNLSSTAEMAADPEIEELLRASIETIQAQIQELRLFMTELRPPVLVKFGLTKALQNYAESYQEKNPGIRVALEVDEIAAGLTEPAQMALYRICQEALNNIMKHSGADQVQVCLQIEGNEVTLQIQDNGTGFVLPRQWLDLAREGHLGLVGMIERAEASGGHLVVQSSPGYGTTVRVSLPLELIPQ